LWIMVTRLSLKPSGGGRELEIKSDLRQLADSSLIYNVKYTLHFVNNQNKNKIKNTKLSNTEYNICD